MTTSRGITDTRVYDRDGVIDRYGIPPELVPDFIGLKGDTSDNIPGVPGIGDKTAAELLQRFGSLEEVLDHIDEICGAKRKQNLDRARRRRARLQAAGHRQARHPARARRRRVRLRRRPTARSCATSSASSSCASRCAASRRRSARPTRPRRPPPPSTPSPARRAPTATLADVGRLPARRRGGGRRARARDPRGRAVRRATSSGASASTPTARGRCSPATRPSPEDLVAARSGDRPVIAHDAKSLGRGARDARPRHRGRRLPARAGAARVPVPRAVRGARSGRRRRGRGRPPTPCSSHALAALAARGDPRPRPDRPARWRSSCRSCGCCARWSRPGSSSTPSGCRRSRRGSRPRPTQLEREIFELAGEEFTLGSPRQLEEILFGKLGPVAQAPRQDRLLDRRPRAPGDPLTSIR